ncbi:MAG: hypothetical protein HC834_09630 [Rhodospirillales bacterium]|nr:hypothetical protein [Rhodospirillales bacterium]
MSADLARHHLLGTLAAAHQECARLALTAAELSDFNPKIKATALAIFNRHNREITKILCSVALDIARTKETTPC